MSETSRENATSDQTQCSGLPCARTSAEKKLGQPIMLELQKAQPLPLELPFAQLLLDQMQQACAILDRSGRITYANRGLAQLVLMTLEQLPGSDFAQLMLESDRGTVSDLLKAALSDGQAIRELQLCAEGRVSVRASVLATRVSGGDSEAFALTITDLTERGLREQTTAAERLARSILDHVADAVVVCDQSLRIIRASHETSRLCGRTVVMDDFETVFPLMIESSEYSSARSLLASALGGRRLKGIEAFWTDRDGIRRNLNLTVGPLWSSDFQVIGCVVTLSDVTGQRRTERELSVLSQQLRFHLDRTPLAVMEADRDLRVTLWTGGARRMFGWSAQEAIGRDCRELLPLGEGNHYDLEQMSAMVMTGNLDPLILNARHRAKDGSVVSCEWHCSSLFDASGKFESLLAMGLDVTEREKAKLQLEQAKESAEAANQAKDHFIAALSHELRTPLSPVLISASAMEGRDDLPPAVQADIQMIRRNIELEARLIDDLLDLTRITRGKMQLCIECVDAHEKIRDALEICRNDIDLKQLQVSVDLSARRRWVNGDGPRLSQIFWNLLTNAAKFTPAHGSISIRTWDGEAGRLRVEISDTGMGIEPEALVRIFEPFEQVSREVAHRFGGLGLGLAISKKVAESHGGTLVAHSEGCGRGATFTLELPSRDGPPIASAWQALPENDKMKTKLRILVVEDHADTARILRNLLRDCGHEVAIAGSLASARSELAGRAFDLLISDLGLPDGNGLDLMREIRSGFGVPGIALSGYGMAEDIARSREAGFRDHIIKPVNLSALEAAIERVMQ